MSVRVPFALLPCYIQAMQFDVLTLFPQMFDSVLSESILKRAREKGIIEVHFHQIRDFSTDKHHTVDDQPYGGGPGMVMRCEPLYGAWKAAKARSPIPARTIYLSPQGKPLKQERLESLAGQASEQRLILICGRYEGIDERFLELCVDEEISLGDFVLSGGELAAMTLIDGIMRLLPGALGNAESHAGESFSSASKGLLEFPQYTRPPEFEGKRVPDILLSGDHARIAKWREAESLKRTQQKRPDLLSTRKG